MFHSCRSLGNVSKLGMTSNDLGYIAREQMSATLEVYFQSRICLRLFKILHFFSSELFSSDDV